MNAVAYLKRHGLAVRLSGKRVRVSPASRLTDDMRRYIKAHRLELIAELASGDGLARRCNWTVIVPGYPPFTMIGNPMTHAEAQAAARARWEQATVK
ncbi:hypothetical protein SAMN05216578_105103 [Halopseudomonas formosensis]|jgi:hypothetical protein|uniref:TubC N-terminal docking domain-containing protein n=1 Tax=Halopseudomonas formosensis TaxID=1002526 RepID=A0A1I6BPC3_9GAMM|nr:hypothetical protein [Halopseudomonas formosensis]SFQ82785.1 hypothetical protein SAMN05216578_105103 [Halopseudomonas formosensis]